MAGQTAQINWRDGSVPVSTRFDDPYFSVADGLAETRHVFLAGNDLPARFRPGFVVAELGFGTGLNMLATWKAWQDFGTTGELTFTSFERFPMAVSDMTRALQGFPELGEHAALFLSEWDKGSRKIRLPGLICDVIVGDARKTLPEWDGMADAWFLDGFSPAKNPELWGADLMHAIGQHTAPGGSFATYSAAGSVRRALSGAGFSVSRVAGFGQKRHMTIGRMDHTDG